MLQSLALWGFVSAFSLASANAQTSIEESVSAKDAQQIAMALATCAGIWDAISEVAALDQTPATSEQFHNMGNGAETAAMWVLASHFAITEKKATSYGSWSELTAPKRETGKTMIMALLENSGDEEAKIEVERCQAMTPEQENILQMMRADRVRKAQGFDALKK